MDTPEPKPPLPQLPENLDDSAALDNWYRAWNTWIADEAGRRNWLWLKPLTKATLREIVEEEKQLRTDITSGRQRLELATARSDLNALEAHLRATDPQYEAKRAILVPILRPIFKHILPVNWKALFEQAYVELQVPASGPTPEEQELAEARNALNALESRLKAHDPAYESKKALLLPIFQPLFKQLPPSKWTEAFAEAYAGVQLATESTSQPQSENAAQMQGDYRESAKEAAPVSGAQELYDMLPGNPALVLLNWREIIDKVHQEFDKAETAGQHDALLRVFTATMNIVEASLEIKNKPEMLEEFRKARTQDYKTLIVQECLVGENMDGKILYAVTRREIAAGRMASDCTPMIDTPRPTALSPDGARMRQLNAEVDRQRGAATAGRAPQRGSRTLLLYKLDGHPDQVGASKVDPPVDGGAFFLDFSRPLKITRRFLGIQNHWIGTAVEMSIPIVHQGEQQGGYMTGMYSSDPRFVEVRALWKARYPSTRQPPEVPAAGFKIVADMAAQFPDGC